MMDTGIILLALLFVVAVILSKLHEDKRHAEKVRLTATIYDQDNEKIGKERHKMSYDEYREHIKNADTTKEKTDDEKDKKSRKRKRPG